MWNRKEWGMRNAECGNGKIGNAEVGKWNVEEWKDSDQGIWNFKREAFRGITRGSG